MEQTLGEFTSGALRTASVLVAVAGVLTILAGLNALGSSIGDDFASANRGAAIVLIAIGSSTLVTALLLSAASVVIRLLRDARAELTEIKQNTAVLNRI
jgi:bifunctional ADP-heptose synthase (sugar kinase/adenylyltransferase)